MNEWKCTIKTPSNFLQDVYVNAYSHSDAVEFAENSTGGRCINAVLHSTSSNHDDDGGNSLSQSSQDLGFIFFLLIAAFVIYSWKWILLTGIISLVIWGIIHYMKE